MNATVWKGKAPARLRSGYALPPPCGGLPLPNAAHEVHCKSLQFQCRLHLQFRCRLILRPFLDSSTSFSRNSALYGLRFLVMQTPPFSRL